MHTSASINSNFDSIISHYSHYYNISKSHIFIIIIKKIISNINCLPVKNILIEYQRNNGPINKKIDYYVDEKLYSKLILLRNKHRISISLLAFAGFLFFWDEIIESLDKNQFSEKIITIFYSIFLSYVDFKSKYSEYCLYLQNRLGIQLE